MSNLHFTLNALGKPAPLIFGRAEIAPGEASFTVDYSEEFPSGILTVVISDRGQNAQSYSYTESNGTITFHTSPFSINDDGHVLPREFKARFDFMIFGKP